MSPEAALPSKGDRVSTTKSDDDILAGSVGRVRDPTHDGKLNVEFSNGKRFNMLPEELTT